MKGYPLLALVFFVARFALAEPPEPKPGPNVQIELRCLTVPQAQALPIVRKLRSPRAEEKKEALLAIDDMLAKGTATLLGWPVVTTHAGKRAFVEACEEIRYATEFHPSVTNVFTADANAPEIPKGAAIKGSEYAQSPSAFETRNTGVTLEVEPTLSEDGKWIYLTFAAQHVMLKSTDRVTVERQFTAEQKIEKVIVQQPRFVTLKVQTSTSLTSGAAELAGLFKSPIAENVLELFILEAEIVSPK